VTELIKNEFFNITRNILIKLTMISLSKKKKYHRSFFHLHQYGNMLSIKQDNLYERSARSRNLSIILSAFPNILSYLYGYVLRKQRRSTFNIRSIFWRKIITEAKILSDPLWIIYRLTQNNLVLSRWEEDKMRTRGTNYEELWK